MNKDETGVYQAIRKNKLYKHVMNGMWKPFVLLAAVYASLDPRYRSPETWKIIMDKEARTGLLAGSIFNTIIFHPSEDNTFLRKETANAGQVASFDFERERVFGKESMTKVRTGSLFAFPLPEILPRSAFEYTPLTYDMLDIENVLAFTKTSFSDLLNWEFVIKTTYGFAYKSLGLQGFHEELRRRNIIDMPVYQVTPKGNGLVFIDSMGDKKKEKEVRRLVLSQQWLPT